MTASQIDHRELEPSTRRISSSPPPPQHASGTPITELLWESAADEWKATANRVQAVLRQRGVDPHTAEDLVQDVALRILLRGEQFKDATHRERWALTVAWRLAKNRWRDDGRLKLGDPPDVSGGRDPVEVVAARESLHRVVDAFHEMSEQDQAAVILGFEPAGQSGAIAVRRHRARVRLARVRSVLALGVVRLRQRVESVFEALGPPVVGAAMVFSPFFAEPPGASGIEAVPTSRPPEVIEVGPSIAADEPRQSLRPAALPRVRIARLGATADGVPAAGKRDAVVPIHHHTIRVDVEPDPRPRPLVCVVGACVEHPARGALTP